MENMRKLKNLRHQSFLLALVLTAAACATGALASTPQTIPQTTPQPVPTTVPLPVPTTVPTTPTQPQPAQATPASTTSCDPLNQSVSGNPSGCGAQGEPCCDSLVYPDQPVCESGSTCVSGCCVPCGGFDEPCCPPGAIPEPSNGGCFPPQSCRYGTCSAT